MQTPTAMSHKIAILGAGAIGQLLFHQLAGANSSPDLIVRTPNKADPLGSANTQSLCFTTMTGEQITREAQLIWPTSDPLIKPLIAIDLLIVCVKAYQVLDALKPLLPKLKPECHLLLLHNGMGTHIDIAPYLCGRGLSLGTTSQGGLRSGRWQVTQTGTGVTQLGHYCGSAMPLPIKRRLLNNIPGSQWCDAILPMLWQKLAINIAINPLTALYNCRNGELANPRYLDRITVLLTEVVIVAQADGIAFDKAALVSRVFEVIQLTANNYSSMHQDIYHQRKTEIDAINGYLIARARHHGIATPYNDHVYQEVSVLEDQTHLA